MRKPSIAVEFLQHSLTVAIWELALAVKQERGDFAVDFHDGNRAQVNRQLMDLAEGGGE